MPRRKLIAGNWKMNRTAERAQPLAARVAQAAKENPSIDVALCPPYTSLHAVRPLIGDNAHLGAQDVFWMEEGAFTGQVSAHMLREAGCSFCIVGHSEKRGRFGSTEVDRELFDYFSDNDETIRLKVVALIRAGIRPILCVGETQYERGAGETSSIIFRQLSGALDGLDATNAMHVDVAYEPVWAIGTGIVCEPDEANRVCANIREMVAGLYSEESASAMRILYGGSVKAQNSRSLLSQPEIDGALVGGASLEPNEFIRIMETA